MAGSRIGSLNETSTVNRSGRRPSSAARQRALLHMPCAIGRGKPNSRAAIVEVWIGLRSPDTAAYAPPTSTPTRHSAVGRGGGGRSLAVRGRRAAA